MNVIVTQLLYSPSAGDLSSVSSEHPGLTLSNRRGRSQAETLTLALRKISDAVTTLQEASWLTSAVISSYGSLKSLVSSLCALSFKAR